MYWTVAAIFFLICSLIKSYPKLAGMRKAATVSGTPSALTTSIKRSKESTFTETAR
jgi:hypothetical protein